MKITRIDMQREDGTKATVERMDGRTVKVTGHVLTNAEEANHGKTPIYQAFTFTIGQIEGRPDFHQAARLQELMDGCAGTSGRVLEYVRIIEPLFD